MSKSAPAAAISTDRAAGPLNERTAPHAAGGSARNPPPLPPCLEALEPRVLCAADLAGDAASLLDDALRPLDLLLPRQRVVVGVDITNEGDAAPAGRTRVAFYLSLDGALDPGDVLLHREKNVRFVGGDEPPRRARGRIYLPPTASLSLFSAGVRTPSRLPPGQYYVLAHIDPAGRLEDGSAANNVASSAATLEAPNVFDYVTGSLAHGFDAQPSAGARAKATLDIVNPLPRGATARVDVQLYLSQDEESSGPGEADAVVGSITDKRVRFRRSGVTRLRLPAALPDPPPAGEHRLRALVTFRHPETGAALGELELSADSAFVFRRGGGHAGQIPRLYGLAGERPRLSMVDLPGHDWHAHLAAPALSWRQ